MRQVFFFLIILTGTIFIQPAKGQSAQSLPAGRQTDSLPKKDSLHKNSLPVKNFAFLKMNCLRFKHDSVPPISRKPIQPLKDSTGKKKHDPRRATIYSAILPGAGQVYNGKFWKVPLVYAAIGIPVYFYFDNKSWYKKSQYALAVTVNNSQGDSLNKVDPLLRTFVTNGDVNSIITIRDEVRKNQDYSVLFFLLFYGLNIVDATVDAHLRDFNVNSDLSFKVKPMIIAGPNMIAGVSLVFDIHKGRPKPLNMN
jgi:hypothetical protein